MESTSNVVQVEVDGQISVGQETANIVQFLISTNYGELLHCQINMDHDDPITILSKQLVNISFTGLSLQSDGNFLACSPSRGLVRMSLQSIISVKSPDTIITIKADSLIMAMVSDLMGNTLVVKGQGERAKIGYYREDIPVTGELLSDQMFRGATGLWMLRRYGSDRHHSMLVVSFVSSTILFQLSDSNTDTGEATGLDPPPAFTERSEYYGIDTHRRTLAIENSISGSFLIQACPDRILIFKSNASQDLAGGATVMTEWNATDTYSLESFTICFTSATIMNDHVFALDAINSKLFIFQCRVNRSGSASVTVLCSLPTSQSCNCFAVHLLTELPAVSGSMSPPRNTILSHLGRLEYLVACSITPISTIDENSLCRINFLKVQVEENSSRIDQISEFELDSCGHVNEMQYLKGPYGARLYIGFRDGSLQVLRIGQITDTERESTIECENLFSAVVGKRPVQLIRCKSTSSSEIISIAGSVSIINELADRVFTVELVLQKADHLVRWVTFHDEEAADPTFTSDKRQKNCRFIAVEHEALLVFTSSLVATKRITPFASLTNARHLLLTPNHLICISTPRRVQADDPTQSHCAELAPELLVYNSHLDDRELISRTTLATGDLVIDAIVLDEMHVAIGLRIHNVGQLRILRIPSPSMAPLKRRQSISQSPSTSTTGMPQMIFVCDAGFPHPVSAIASNEGKRIFVSAGTDIHHLLIMSQDRIQFVRTETWRSEVIAMRGNGSDLMAVASSLGGLELFSVDNEGNWLRLWCASRPDLIDRLCWCRRDLVAAADRRGFLHFLLIKETAEGGKSIRRITQSIDRDIPVALAFRASTNTLLVSGVSGLIHELILPV